MDHSALAEACSLGGLDFDHWADQLHAMVADAIVGNAELLHVALRASEGLDARARELWTDHLLESCLWQTGEDPGRLALCDHMVRQGIAQAASPRRWAALGGLAHVACENSSLEGLQWALQREPSGALRPGGSYGSPALHSLCEREVGQRDTLAALAMLGRFGARADAMARDGRNALFRCSDPALARRLIEMGANPWREDADGYTPVGVWLELGLWACAKEALATREGAQDDFYGWGSFGRRPRDGAYPACPRSDRPLFIVACSPCMRGPHGHAARSEALRRLVGMGADPTLPDGRGLDLYARSRDPLALALMERSALGQSRGRSGRSGSAGRL